MEPDDWHDYDVFNLPPPYQHLLMEIEILTDYLKSEKQIRRGYYDPQLGTFRDGTMRTPNYIVLRWKLEQQTT